MKNEDEVKRLMENEGCEDVIYWDGNSLDITNIVYWEIQVEDRSRLENRFGQMDGNYALWRWERMYERLDPQSLKNMMDIATRLI